jgi:leader peptidase (prepilin peptidase) / N-methyltransferase
MSYPLPSLVVATGLLVAVAGWDIARRRIPNWLNASLAVTGLGAQALFHGGWPALGGGCAAIATLVILWWPWSRGRLGGGDVKAMIASATWLGPDLLFAFFLWAAVAGGVAAVVCLMASSPQVRRQVRGNLELVASRVGLSDAPMRGQGRVSVPFAAAASLAALCLLWRS